MFGSLKKLFGDNTSASPAAKSAQPENKRIDAPFLRRETVFDRQGKVAGHFFHIELSSLLANAEIHRQCAFDRILLDTLNASPDAWNTTTAFIPISAASLDQPGLDRLKTANLVLMINLAPEITDIAALAERLDQLRERGFSYGLFRQPQHPAFPILIQHAAYAGVDIESTDPNTVRDFSAAIRSIAPKAPRLLACRVTTEDDHRFCHQWHFRNFQGNFATAEGSAPRKLGSDPNKAQLLNLMRLIQGDAETKDIAQAMKLDPLLSFRILRYLNSAAIGLTRKVESLEKAVVILGRQRVSRWVAVMLFSVREPQIGDWLLIENALTRGRLMEVLGVQLARPLANDPLFLTGILSCLEKLLHRPLAEILADIPVAEEIREALLKRQGPFAELLAVVEACEGKDADLLKARAQQLGLDPEQVNRALLAATAWASEVTEYWD